MMLKKYTVCKEEGVRKLCFKNRKHAVLDMKCYGHLLKKQSTCYFKRVKTFVNLKHPVLNNENFIVSI